MIVKILGRLRETIRITPKKNYKYLER